MTYGDSHPRGMVVILLQLILLSLTLRIESAGVSASGASSQSASGASRQCTLAYDGKRCVDDPCPDEAPLMAPPLTNVSHVCLQCDGGAMCLDESHICNGYCRCPEPDCLDESPAECTKQKYRAMRKVLVIGGALLAIPLAIVISYYFCCGGKRKRNRLMGSILSDHTSQQQQQQNQPQTLIPVPTLNAPSRTNSVASARSRSNSAAESTRSDSLRTGRPIGRNLRRQRGQRTFGVDNPQLLEALIIAHRSSTRSLEPRSSRNRRHMRDLQVGGSLRLPSARHSSHRDDGSIETYFRLLADAPPSYSDSCINSQSEACASRSRDLLTVEGDEPPPSYKEVLEKKFPMFGSFNEIQASEASCQATTVTNTNDVSIVVESAI